MTRKAPIVIAALLAGLLGWTPTVAVAAPIAVTTTTVPNHVATVLGGTFTLDTEVTNSGPSPTGTLLAHLNVASITGDVYVDPEDWSDNRSQQLELRPGESRMLSWDLQAVNSGTFAAYVVVLPFGGRAAAGDNLVVSPMVKLNVEPRSTLNAKGSLPVVILIPGLLGVLAAATYLRLRRRR